MPADSRKAHGSPKSLTVATPARNSHGAPSTLDDFDEALEGPLSVVKPAQKPVILAVLWRDTL